MATSQSLIHLVPYFPLSFSSFYTQRPKGRRLKRKNDCKKAAFVFVWWRQTIVWSHQTIVCSRQTIVWQQQTINKPRRTMQKSEQKHEQGRPAHRPAHRASRLTFPPQAQCKENLSQPIQRRRIIEDLPRETTARSAKRPLQHQGIKRNKRKRKPSAEKK